MQSLLQSWQTNTTFTAASHMNNARVACWHGVYVELAWSLRHASIFSSHRVSQSAERLFKAMSQLRGQMVAARGIAQRPGPNPTYSSNSRTVYPSVASDDNANGYTSTSVVAPCPVSLSEQNAHSSGACATQSSSTGVQAPPVDVNAYTYSPAVPQTATANGNSAASFCRPHAGDGLAFNGTTQPDGVPSPVSLTPKSLTEEADEEITKILAKLQKEDRCTAAPPSASGALVSSAPGSILPQQVNSASSYAFMSNSAAMSGQNAPKVDGLAGTPCTTGPPLGEVEPRGQQQTASEDGLPPQLMTGLLSSEFPPQTEAFMGSANSAPTHQAVSGYGPNAAQTREPLSGTYASMTGPETNASSRLFGQQQQLQQNTATSSIGNRQMYSDVSKTLAQGSGQQPWSPQPPQATVKAEVRDVFTPPPSKKGHVESRSGNVIPPVAAPQLRSLLARKLPPPTARAATPNPCFTSNSYAERNGSQPQSPTAPQTSDQIFPFGRHQRVYLTPNQGIISYNDAPKPSKLLPPAHVDFGSSLQQKPLHIQNQQNSNSPQFVPQHQQSHAQLKEMPHPLSPDVQAIGHQQIMSVESPAGLSHPQRLGDADPSASGSGLPHCVALNRLNAFTSGPLDALTGPSELSSSGYSSWTTLQCPAPSAQGVPNTRG
ncbi:hypothetical protein BIW11_12486 [Tropilaelaps mercedesae]|uniref:Uncharacterized protein n=1 Tax=Tropilaelaps mercedesae TaxID=418985 RepID=A0A1V9X6G3_9ACAR|nr:hypothetical protein BIW11_12486 [Tropilaelaps mercedesae]